jgi:hypothetical protein
MKRKEEKIASPDQLFRAGPEIILQPAYRAAASMIGGADTPAR